MHIHIYLWISKHSAEMQTSVNNYQTLTASYTQFPTEAKRKKKNINNNLTPQKKKNKIKTSSGRHAVKSNQ